VSPTSNTTPMFDSLIIRDARPLAFVKRTFQVVVGAYLIIGLIAGYRAFYQVHSLDLNTSERVLRRGSTITTRVVTYARTPVSVRLELIQGSHSEDLSIRGVPDNDWAFLIRALVKPRKLTCSQQKCSRVFNQDQRNYESPRLADHNCRVYRRRWCGN